MDALPRKNLLENNNYQHASPLPLTLLYGRGFFFFIFLPTRIPSLSSWCASSQKSPYKRYFTRAFDLVRQPIKGALQSLCGYCKHGAGNEDNAAIYGQLSITRHNKDNTVRYFCKTKVNNVEIHSRVCARHPELHKKDVLVYHAMTPASGKTLRELGLSER